MADKPNSASDKAMDDILSTGAQGPKAPVSKPYHDKEAITVFCSNSAEPHHLSHLEYAGLCILAR